MKNQFSGFKGFGTHAGGVTPKSQASHGKALGITQAVVPPHKKGPASVMPMAIPRGMSVPRPMPVEPSAQPPLALKFPKGLP